MLDDHIGEATSSDGRARAPRNRTLTVSRDEQHRLQQSLATLSRPATLSEVVDHVICQEALAAISLLPSEFCDLIVVDPPYNRTKQFNGTSFSRTSESAYQQWVHSWMNLLPRLLKQTGSIYICCDWQSSPAVYLAAKDCFLIRNRITWEREKGRGSQTNWKNSSEDIWFCTKSDTYYFDVEAVKLRRRVIAPYRNASGSPKDWQESGSGQGFRLTHPSNLWTDITVPFWSMPENTDHPTQKPEKLVAKMVLASCEQNGVVFDPFAGVGTTAVVAKKLGRRFVAIELDPYYCCLAQKRLELAEEDRSIQGYKDGVFWERNTLTEQLNPRSRRNGIEDDRLTLFATDERTATK